MKRFIIPLILLFTSYEAWCCPVCERQQPKVLKGIVHGAGPNSQWDYLIIWAVIFITLISLYFTVKWLLRPGETNTMHIKYSILKQD